MDFGALESNISGSIVIHEKINSAEICLSQFVWREKCISFGLQSPAEGRTLNIKNINS